MGKKVNEELFLTQFRNIMRRRGKVTSQDLSDYFDINKATTRKYLKKLIRKGLVARRGKGKATQYGYP